MPDAHVTVQPSGQAIATSGGHRLATGSRPRKSHHCSSPTATPVARPVMSRAPIPVPAPVSNAPTASPIATPKAVAKIHSVLPSGTSEAPTTGLLRSPRPPTLRLVHRTLPPPLDPPP